MGSAFLLRGPFPCAEPVHPLRHGASCRLSCTGELVFVCELQCLVVPSLSSSMRECALLKLHFPIR
jgi:hypothetical protein